LPKEKNAGTSMAMALTPAQLRAARALLGWSRDDLAEHSKTSAETMKNFELRGTDPRQGTVIKWQRALERSGVRFLDAEDGGEGEGVRFRTVKGKR
jgi:transcriptional regulator with XRE-family HTH domain